MTKIEEVARAIEEQIDRQVQLWGHRLGQEPPGYRDYVRKQLEYAAERKAFYKEDRPEPPIFKLPDGIFE